MKIGIFADDPESGVSYGYQGSFLAQGLAPHHEVHYVAPQILYRRVIKTGRGYIWGVGWNPNERTPTNIGPFLKSRPEVLITVGDVQDTAWVAKFRRRERFAWVPWVPWDSDDDRQQTVLWVQKSFHEATLPVVLSKFGQEYFREAGFEAEQIYNVVDPQVYHPMEWRAPWSKDREVLLFVGRPVWRKKIELLFGVVKELVSRGRDKIILHLHSSRFDPSASSNLQLLIHAMNLHKHIIWTQNLEWNAHFPVQLLNRIYNNADVYVTTSSGEGMGLPIVEAMACEKPFVAVDCTTTPEFSGGGKRGLAVPADRYEVERQIEWAWADIEAFADAVEKLLDNPKRRARMGKAGRRWVQANCAPHIVSKKWLRILEQMECPQIDVEEPEKRPAIVGGM